VSKGPSAVQFGGGNWIDMVCLHRSPKFPIFFICFTYNIKVYEIKKPEARARYGC
jgi:hypothetical protein